MHHGMHHRHASQAGATTEDVQALQTRRQRILSLELEPGLETSKEGRLCRVLIHGEGESQRACSGRRDRLQCQRLRPRWSRQESLSRVVWSGGQRTRNEVS